MNDFASPEDRMRASGGRTIRQSPVIIVESGRLPELATEGEQALIALGLPVYQRGRSLVRPIRQEVPASGGRTTVAAAFSEINIPAMIDLLEQAADWRGSGRKARRKSLVPVNPPSMVANIILSRCGWWSLPPVAGVVTAPTLRSDGSLLTAEGYDRATRLCHVLDPDLRLPPLAGRSFSRQHAQEALALLEGLLTGFPLVSDVDRAVALSALITPVVRRAMTAVPLHAIRASTAGSGKSFLVDVTSTIATGRPCPVTAAGQTSEETEMPC